MAGSLRSPGFHHLHRPLLACWIILLLVFSAGCDSSLPASNPVVLELTADGPLTAAMVEYLERGLSNASRQNAELLILQLNTPGGSIDLMNAMVQAIRQSQIPIVVYVAPRGAMAGSAGALITLAAHASAMAPETSIGAASPVGMQGEELGETIQAKEKNILKATVRSLTANRPPEAVVLAEAMVQSAEAVSALEAYQAGLVDFVVSDVDDLLQKIDGFAVETVMGQQIIETTGAVVRTQPESFIEELLGILTNPNIVFLLLTIGVQAILIELSSPGGWVAGFIGAVCLALSAYGLGVLDVNWFGVIFLVIAFALFIVDIKAPTHGALTAAGVASLIIGGLVLFNSPNLPAVQPRVSVPLVIIMSAATGGIFFVILLFAVKAQKTPVQTGMESLIGRSGRAMTDIAPNTPGQIQLASELWTAELADGEQTIIKGETIQVVKTKGLRVIVAHEK